MGFTRNQFLRTVLAGIRSFRSTSWRLLLLLTVVFVSACGGSSGGDVSQPEPQSNGTATGPVGVGEVVPPEDMRVIATAEAKPYRPDSDYASVMLDCMYVPDVESLCPFSTLPYIGQNNEFVSVDDVMQRGSGLRFVGLSRVMIGDNYTSYSVSYTHLTLPTIYSV